VGPLGLPALGLGIALGAWAEAILLLVVLRRREPALDVPGIVGVGIRSLAAAAAAGAVAFAVAMAVIGPTPGDKLSLLLGGGLAAILGGLAYLAAAFALRIPELPLMISIVIDLVRRRRS
jgi:peptidoglycan biosynthesis protein MviN/MurJ (putative lipid II flippase)